jgi:catechol 2,3-dioxygenase
VAIGTVFLKVADIARQLRFYQDIIGLQIQHQEGATVYLGSGQEDLLALIPTPEGKRYRGATGLYHFALLLPSRYHLALTLKHLVETQTSLEGLSDHLVSEAVYLADTEGNGIEIYADRPRSTWYQDGQLQMATIPINVPDLMQELAAKPANWQPLPPETRMGHIHLHVGSIPQTERFYQEVLGLEVMFHLDSATFLAYDGYHHHLGANTWAGRNPAPADALGLEKFILKVSAEQMEATLKALDQQQIEHSLVEGQYLLRDISNIQIMLAS